MSKQGNSKLLNYSFLFLILSIGFPFQSIGIPINMNANLEFEAVSDYKIINGLLGNGFVGKSIFDSSTYFTQSDPPVNTFNKLYQHNFAYGQFFDNSTEGEREDPIDDVEVGRHESSETVQIGDRKFITKTVPKWVENNEGEFVERIVNQDSEGIQFESAKFSYFYDESECAMTVFDSGRITNSSQPIQKYNGWVAKTALNGTDNWLDLPQNNIDCDVTLVDDEEETRIISVRGDEKGVFTENYIIPKPLREMETVLTFFNNDTALNNDKFAFTNVLSDIPTNFRFSVPHQIIHPAGNYTAGELAGTNGTYFNPDTLQMENYTITDYSWSEEIEDTYKVAQYTTSIPNIPDEYDEPNVTYIADELDISYTDLYLSEGDKNGFAMDYYSGDKERVIPLKYKFINDSLDKLWNIKIVSDNQQVTHAYIDYMNINYTTPVGSTAILDPAVETNLGSVYVADTKTFGVFTNDNGAGACAHNEAELAFTNDFRWWHSLSGGTFPNQNESNHCESPINQVDITAIPDLASVQQLDFNINVTSVSCTTSSINSCIIASQFMDFEWSMGNAEQILFLDGSSLGNTVYEWDGDAENIEAHIFNGAGGILYPDPSLPTNYAIPSQIDPNAFTDLFETYLESGKDYMIWSGCMGLPSEIRRGCGVGANAGGSSPAFNRVNTILFDINTFDLQITWEIFTLAGAPQDLTCESTSPTDLFLDWEIPLTSGGAPITGYQIERSTNQGQSFVIIEPNSSPSPTEYTDTTAFAGISFVYRVSAINDVGAGDFAEISCGVAGVSDNVDNLIASNVGLEIVALDWTEPIFTGNTDITGYQVERTTGTPQNIPDEWYVNVNDIADPPSQCYYQLGFQQFVDPVGGEGLLLKNHPTESGTFCHVAFWAVFDTSELDGKTVEVTWRGEVVTNGGLHGEVWIYDGRFKGGHNGEPNVNFLANGTTAFPFRENVDTTGDGAPDSGIGLIQTISARTNDWAMQTDSAQVDLGLATLDEVTLLITMKDDGFATNLGGEIRLQEIDIKGIGNWIWTTPPTGSTLGGVECFSSCGFGQTVASRSEVHSIYTFDDDTLDPLPPTNFIPSVDGFFVLVNDTATDAVEYLDLTVAQLQQYGYRISAWNEAGLSDTSNVAEVFTAGEPAIVAQPTVTATGTQTINIDWEEPNLNFGSLVGYEIERKIGQAGIFSTLVAGLTETSHDDGTGLFTLTPATEYCYKIMVETTIGEASDFSPEACATTFDAPSEVENLTVIALDGSSVDMSFETPLDDGGSSILGYKVERKIGGNSFETLDELTNIQFRNDTGLPVGTLIQYRVSATNQFGFGNTVTVGDTTDATPQVPQDFTCSASSSTSLTLNWETPESFSAPTGYQVDRRDVGGSFSTIEADTASTDTQYLDDGLPVDSTFEYRILAHTAEGDTGFTPIITCSTLTAPDFPPEDLQGDFTTTVPHQMVLAWDIPDTFGVPITSFRVERDDGAGYNEIASVSGSTFMYIDQAPDNDVSQKYRVFTVGSEGDSPPTIAIPFPSNQTSHWHYEKTIDDTGKNKNAGMVTGTVNFNNTGINGLGMLFDDSTYITVDNESDYDYDQDVASGFITHYRGNSTGTDQAIISKSSTLGSTGFNMFIDSTGVLGVRLTNTATTNEIHILGSTNVTDNSLHFLGVGYNGNGTANGVSMMVDGSFETKNVITDNLSSSILNNESLTLGATSSGADTLLGLLDDTRVFGSDTLDDATLQAIAENSITTVIPINATVTIVGTTFADISSETPTITMTSGYPLPLIDTIDLQNFTATTVNSQSPAVIIDSVTGEFTLDPVFFNVMSSTSNYTAIGSLTNSEETFPLLSNFDIQVPLFTFSGDFFFQQQRNDAFTVLSFNYTQTDIPFDLACNFKSTLFENGTTVVFTDVFFVQHLQPVPALEDVVVACIDQNSPVTDPDAPSFGGSNALLSFVSFGDTTGIGNFLNFTNNFGDFFGVGLPFLFVIILAAAFTGRSAPTGILIIGIALGIMWGLGILELDPFMWGIILVLIILGVLGGKKFL